MAISKDQPMSATEYKKLIEAYKEQNPAKYELKKEALEAKLKALAPAKKTKE